MTDERKLLLIAAASLRQLESISNSDRIPESYRMNALGLIEKHLGIAVGMDGDCAFARSGDNLQVGDAEFVKPADGSSEAAYKAQAYALSLLVEKLVSRA